MATMNLHGCRRAEVDCSYAFFTQKAQTELIMRKCCLFVGPSEYFISKTTLRISIKCGIGVSTKEVVARI
jgi:hypothetical protein